MAFPLLKLLVLRTHRLEEVKKFYESLGMEFVKERHAQGPSYYAAAMGAAVLQLHPLPKDAPDPDKSAWASWCGTSGASRTSSAPRASGSEPPSGIRRRSSSRTPTAAPSS